MSIFHHDHHHHHEHGPGCDCGHEHMPVRLTQTLVGVVFVLNAFIVDWFFQQGTTISSASAMIGAIILGTPIVLIAIKDLRIGRRIAAGDYVGAVGQTGSATGPHLHFEVRRRGQPLDPVTMTAGLGGHQLIARVETVTQC